MLKSSVRLALLTSVTWQLAAGQPPDQERVDRAEQDLAARGARAQAVVRVEQVLDLRAGEIGIDDQAGLARGTAARGRRPSADRRSARVMRLCQTMALATGRPRVALPEDRGLALIGDADRGEVGRRDAGACAIASRAVASCDVQIASGSCSTCPGPGNSCGNSCCADRHDRCRARSNTIARLDVVP